MSIDSVEEMPSITALRGTPFSTQFKGRWPYDSVRGKDARCNTHGIGTEGHPAVNGGEHEHVVSLRQKAKPQMTISTSSTWYWIRDAIESYWVQWATKLQYSPVLYQDWGFRGPPASQVRAGRTVISLSAQRRKKKVTKVMSPDWNGALFCHPIVL